MRYAMDFEFIEDGERIHVLSMALVCEDGRELYLENWYADLMKANPWVRENVLPHLHLWEQPCPDDGHKCPLRTLKSFGPSICQFIGEEVPIFVTYYGAYDWVAFCQLFGAMMDLPKGWPMYAHDLRSLLDMRGLQCVKQPDDMPHQALSDARWILENYMRYFVSPDRVFNRAQAYLESLPKPIALIPDEKQ